MSLELINALGTVLTACVIAATAIAALVQLRHMRAGNQINAMLAIGEELSAAPMADAQRVVRDKLPALIDDPGFRAYNSAQDGGGRPPDVKPEYEEARQAVSYVCNALEELGILVKNGIVDVDLFLDRYSWVILRAWQRTEKAVADARADTGQEMIWENFEYLAVLSDDWIRHHPSTYPKGMRRMPLPDRSALKV